MIGILIQMAFLCLAAFLLTLGFIGEIIGIAIFLLFIFADPEDCNFFKKREVIEEDYP